MYDLLSEYYLFLKAMHIISVISWMAAIFYLPRLFVYHAQVATESESAQQFIIMENRLVRIIMTPAMIATFVFGGLLFMVPGMLEAPAGWLHMKLLLVILLAGMHGFFIRCMNKFAHGIYPYTSKTFRLFNEVPPIIMMIIVFLVVFKPF